MPTFTSKHNVKKTQINLKTLMKTLTNSFQKISSNLKRPIIYSLMPLLIKEL